MPQIVQRYMNDPWVSADLALYKIVRLTIGQLEKKKGLKSMSQDKRHSFYFNLLPCQILL